jgi:hypothetical protein
MDTPVRSAIEVAEEQLGTLSDEQVRRIRDAGLDARHNAVHETRGVGALSAEQLDRVQRTGELTEVAEMLYSRHMRRIRDHRAGAVAPIAGGAPGPELRPKTPPKDPHGTCRLTLTINGQHYAVKKVECRAAGASRCYELKKPGTAGTTYHIATFPYGTECDCPDFTFRREGTDSPCKHIKALSVFGMIEGPAAVAKATPVKMTRESLESGAVRHPFERAGLGPGPFQCFATLRNLDSEITRKSAAQMHVSIVACGMCHDPNSNTLYVIEGRDKQRHAVCYTCMLASKDGGLIRRMTHEEHERRRLLDSISTERRGR